MEEVQTEKQYEDEIDLRELFMLFWKKKFFIVGLAVIGAVLAALVSLFLISPVYDTELKIDINIPNIRDKIW